MTDPSAVVDQAGPATDPVTVDVIVLRLLCAATGLAVWASTGLLPVLAAAPPLAGIGLGGAVLLSVVLLVARPQTSIPAAFLVAALAARLALSSIPVTSVELVLTGCFVAAAVACHSLSGLCAVLDGGGRVEVMALLPGARRFGVVIMAAAVSLVGALLVPTAVTVAAGAVLAVLAAAALVATVVAVARRALR